MSLALRAAARECESRALVALVSVAACSLLFLVLPGNAAATDVLPPPRADLAAVQFPSLAGLEPEVRAQLRSQQASIVAAVRKTASAAALSEAYGALGQVYQAYSLLSSAEECYRNATRLDPQDFRWAYLLGNVYQKEGRLHEAIEQYASVMKQRPSYLAAAVNLGTLKLRLDQVAAAKAAFQAVLEVDPRSAASLYGLGQAALSEKDYAHAAELFAQALKAAPTANRIHYALAMAYRGMGELEKARSELALQGSVGVRPADPLVDGLQALVRGERLHIQTGKMAFRAGRYSSAADEFRKALAVNPKSSTAMVDLSATLAQLGDRDGAAKQLEAAVAIAPRNATAQFNLGVLLATEGRAEQAIPHLRMAATLWPKDSQTSVFLARQLAKVGKTHEALAELSRFLQEDPANEDAELAKINLLQRLGRYREAMAAAKQASSTYPTRGRTAITLAAMLASTPDAGLRDGAQALDLAQRVFRATGRPSNGAIVALALSELGRCAEAAKWAREMIALAKRQGDQKEARAIGALLPRFENGPPCRPPTTMPEGKAPPSGQSGSHRGHQGP
ncbi:MAG TPA: tetratricopeptide repeat protein [Thermoanaerobaculia bacterium]|nr:tetratricopeptide repeat protein [Thermoanaerobaculia bacterium]